MCQQRTRGVGVDDRSSRRDGCRSDGPESNRSSAHLKFDHGRCQESSTRGASVHGHQHGSVRIAQEARTISRYGLRGSRVGEASNPGPPHLRRLRRASQSRMASHQFPRMKRSWFTPTRAGTCCPQMPFSRLSLTPIQRMGGPSCSWSCHERSIWSETSLVIRFPQMEDPGTRKHPGELHWSHNLHRALPGLSKIGNHCGHQCLCQTVLQHWMRIARDV